MGVKTFSETTEKSITFITSAVRKSNHKRQTIGKHEQDDGNLAILLLKPSNLGCQHFHGCLRKTFSIRSRSITITKGVDQTAS